MTIKKRLYISNILMLVIPMLLSMLFITSMFFAIIEIFEIDNFRWTRIGDRFYVTVDYVNDMLKDIPSSELSDIEKYVESFNSKYSSPKIFLTIYTEDTPLFYGSTEIDAGLLDMVMSGGDGIAVIQNRTAVYRIDCGETHLLLIDINYTPYNNSVENKYYFFGIAVLAVLILIIVLTNKVLTRYIFRSIMVPIDTLTYGVHQIRDGKLEYRISYSGKDEFAAVCADFNEMAERLSESVNRRQKDDANRKELIAGISHDLRTPLTSIKAYLEGIEKDVAVTAEKKKQYFVIIKNKTSELENIINQLFMFSKIDIGEFPFRLEKIDLNGELTGIVNGFSEEYNDFSVSLLPCDTEIYVNIDVQQFRNAVTNIVENSVKYKDKKKGRIEISCRAVGNEAVIELTDNGPGVSEESLDKLFNVFYRSDPSRNNTASGSGLGLAITAKVIEGFGGGITARNANGGGLSVIIKLPLLRKETKFEK